MNEKDIKDLARYSKALGHPIRIQILKVLTSSPCCYTGDIAEELPIARSTLSQHFKELKEAGLIKGEYNPPKIKYCINKENWDNAQRLLCGLFNQFKIISE
ncbi:MAG: winged helix-turn-helix transcriptional regulator [Salinivirgaceae bacterium]|nr:winged helix-turn-helix transcriptional regulator [Salinivirgaceae bacterium]